MTLQLAARRFWNAPRAYERYGLKLDSMLLDDPLANRCGDSRELGPVGRVVASEVPRIDLGDECSGLTITAAQYESGATPGANRGVPFLCCQLDVLRVVLGTAYDQHVLEASGYDKLSFVQYAQVAGAEKGALAGGESCAERELRLLRLQPVTLRHTRRRDPDLADSIWGARLACLGIDNANRSPEPR